MLQKLTGILFLCTVLYNSGVVHGQDLKVSSPSGSTLYATVDDAFTILCEVTPADSNTVVVWYRDDTEIDATAGTNFLIETEILDGVLKSSLVKENVENSDAGTYKCQVYQSEEFTLVNVEVSEIQVKDAVVSEPEKDAQITCEMQGSLTGGTYMMTWQHNGDEIQDKEDKYVINTHNNTLTIKKVAFNDDLGEYLCIFKLDNGQESFNRTVTVYGSAHVKKFDKSKNLVQDDTLNIECQASGFPLPSVYWYFEENALNNSDRVRFTSSDKSEVENTTLRISSMQYEDAGEYTCEAMNMIQGMENNYNQTITVRVKDKLAALWPFLGICVEVTVLCIIIFIYEKRRQKRMAAEEAKEEASHLTNSHANTADVRQRKV